MSYLTDAVRRGVDISDNGISTNGFTVEILNLMRYDLDNCGDIDEHEYSAAYSETKVIENYSYEIHVIERFLIALTNNISNTKIAKFTDDDLASVGKAANELASVDEHEEYACSGHTYLSDLFPDLFRLLNPAIELAREKYLK